MRCRIASWLLPVGLVLALAVDATDCLAKSCGPPPRAKPQRRKGGESVPPLPLPATPLRRTEKKRPPAPPALVGKVQYGKMVAHTDKSGKKSFYRDWTTDPNDINALVNLTNHALGIRYRRIHTAFGSFSYNPAEIPALFVTGHEAFELTDEQRKKIYWFINDGGYLIGDACCGSPDFFNAFVAEMKKIFPKRPVRRLQPDHPIFVCHYKVGPVEVALEGKSAGGKFPEMYGINFGCRTAVFCCPYDLSCGWDGHEHATGKRVKIQDARRIGVNLMTYCLSNYQLGRFLSTQRVYHEADVKTRDEFVFAQVVHDGDWDPHPNGVMNFLRFVRSNSTLPIQFKRVAVDLRDPNVLRHPVLYMTGHNEFVLSDAEVAGLRNYLVNGGVVFGSACCGRQAFDHAFRREMAKVLPGGVTMKAIALSHPIYSSRTTVRTAEYSRFLKARQPDLSVPTMEGVSLHGQLAVVYTRYGLGTHWDGQERPFSLAYAQDDALRIGMNVLIYAMTH